jgi:hypothetical protein
MRDQLAGVKRLHTGAQLWRRRKTRALCAATFFVDDYSLAYLICSLIDQEFFE